MKLAAYLALPLFAAVGGCVLDTQPLEHEPVETTREVAIAEQALSAACLKDQDYAFHGDLHAHTEMSDGKKTASELFALADDAGAAFMVITDHEFMANPDDQLAALLPGNVKPKTPSELATAKQLSEDRYEVCFDTVALSQATWNGSFVGGCGMEILRRDLDYPVDYNVDPECTHPQHTNLLFTPLTDVLPYAVWPAGANLYSTSDLHARLLASTASLGQFNHPDSVGDCLGWRPDQRAYQRFTDEQMRLVELEWDANDCPNSNGTMLCEHETYFDFLDRNWHVSPSNNSDHHIDAHGYRFGTGVWASTPTLTASSLKSAIAKRMTFATSETDPTATIQSSVWTGPSYDGCLGGSILKGVTPDSATIVVTATTQTRYDKINLYKRGGELVGQFDCPASTTCTTNFTVNLSSPKNYFVAQAIGPNHYAMGAPIWIEKAGPSDFNGDKFPDIIVRKSNGDLMWYGTNGAGGWRFSDTKVGDGGWGAYSQIFNARDLTGDGLPEILAVNPSTGNLYRYTVDGYGSTIAPPVIHGTGWNDFDKLMGVGDFNSDGHNDLLGRRISDGTLWLWPGKGDGWFNPRVLAAGSGWNGIDQIIAPGDWDQDGKVDVLGVTPAGELRLYRGNGAGGFVAGYIVAGAGGWAPWKVFAIGDFNSDGKKDLLGINKTSGALRFWPGQGSTSNTPASPVTVSTPAQSKALPTSERFSGWLPTNGVDQVFAIWL